MLAVWFLSPGPWNWSPQNVISHPESSSPRTAQTLPFGLRTSVRLTCSCICQYQCWISSRQKHCVSLLHNQAAREQRWACLEKPLFASKPCLKPLLSPGQILHSYSNGMQQLSKIPTDIIWKGEGSSFSRPTDNDVCKALNPDELPSITVQNISGSNYQMW